MSKIRMLGKLVAVEKVKKSQKASNEGFFVMPDVADSLGVVRYVGSEVTDLSEGDRVYYGPRREEVRMKGVDLMVMEVSNVFAVEENTEETHEQAPSQP